MPPDDSTFIAILGLDVVVALAVLIALLMRRVEVAVSLPLAIVVIGGLAVGAPLAAGHLRTLFPEAKGSDARLLAAERDLAAAKGEIAGLKRDSSSLEGRVGSLEKTANQGPDGRIGELVMRVDALDKKLDGLPERVEKLERRTPPPTPLSPPIPPSPSAQLGVSRASVQRGDDGRTIVMVTLQNLGNEPAIRVSGDLSFCPADNPRPPADACLPAPANKPCPPRTFLCPGNLSVPGIGGQSPPRWATVPERYVSGHTPFRILVALKYGDSRGSSHEVELRPDDPIEPNIGADIVFAPATGRTAGPAPQSVRYDPATKAAR